MIYRFLLLSFLLSLGGLIAHAQTTVVLTGLVLDQNEAALPKARVTLQSVNGERKQNATTASSVCSRERCK